MAQATFKVGEKVLCYETDPRKVNKLYRAIVNQVLIVMINAVRKNNVGSESYQRLISSRRVFWCTFVGGVIAGTGEQ